MPQEDKLTIDDVKIDPAFLVFEDAFGGKQFEKTITLRNFGRNSAFIRILPPNSHVSNSTYLWSFRETHIYFCTVWTVFI